MSQFSGVRRARRAILPAMQTAGVLGATIAWSKVDVLTPSQRITAEIQIRGRLRDTINDPEPVFHLRNVSAEPLVPGAVALNGVPEGLFSKALVGGIRTIEPEPPPPDQIMDMIRRYIMFQAHTFMVTGAVQFPKATATAMHNDLLMKPRFFPDVDAP